MFQLIQHWIIAGVCLKEYVSIFVWFDKFTRKSIIGSIIPCMMFCWYWTSRQNYSMYDVLLKLDQWAVLFHVWCFADIGLVGRIIPCMMFCWYWTSRQNYSMYDVLLKLDQWAVLFHVWYFADTSISTCAAWFVIWYFSPSTMCADETSYKQVKRPGPRLNIKTVLSTYGDFHVKDKTAVRTSYL